MVHAKGMFVRHRNVLHPSLMKTKCHPDNLRSGDRDCAFVSDENTIQRDRALVFPYFQGRTAGVHA